MKKLAYAAIALWLLSTAGCYFRLPPYPYDLTFIPAPCPPPVAPPSRDEWQPLAAGDEVQVFAKKELFAMAEQDRVYVCIRVLNTTQRGLAVDLRDPDCTVCPTRWTAERAPGAGGSPVSAPVTTDASGPTPRLRVANAGGATTRPMLPDGGLSPDRRCRLMKDYVDEKLITIPPRSAVEYYCEVPSPSPTRSLEPGQEFTVYLAGRVCATDARATMALVIPAGEACPMRLTRPAQPRLVPMGAVLMQPDGPTILVPTTSTAPESE